MLAYICRCTRPTAQSLVGVAGYRYFNLPLQTDAKAPLSILTRRQQMATERPSLVFLIPFLFALMKIPSDAQLLDLLSERIAVDAEEVRCAHLVAVGLLEHK